MKKILYTLIVLAITLTAVGCASKKKIQPTPTPTARETKAAEETKEAERIRQAEAEAERLRLQAIEAQRIADSIAAAEEAKKAQVQTLYIPRMTIIVNMQGQQMSTPASMKWQRGGGLMVSLMPFIGMEMFRFELGEQGLTVIDKVNRQYAQLNAEQIAQMGARITLDDIDTWIDERILAHADEPQLTLQTTQANIQGTAIISTSSMQKNMQLNLRPTDVTSYRQVSVEQLLKSFK